MLGAALNLPTKAKIVPIDGFGLGMVTLLHQQRRQGMPGRMHPRPWFGVVEIVIALHRLSKMGEGLFVVAFVVLSLASQHGFTHPERGAREVAQESQLCRYAGHGFAEERAFTVCGGRLLERRIGD